MKRSIPPPGSPLRIVLAYVLFGALWIIFSDLLMAQLVPEPFVETVSIAKGWFFIALTALLLYLLISRQHEALVESQQRLSFALDGSNDGLWDVQMDTGSIYLSPRACEILGYQTQDLPQIAKIWSDLVHPDDLPPTQAALNDYLEGRKPVFSVEQRLKTASGEWKWILARGKVVSRDQKGAPVRMAGTHTDITERRRMEESLQEQKKFTEKLIENSSAATSSWTRSTMSFFGTGHVKSLQELPPLPWSEPQIPGRRFMIMNARVSRTSYWTPALTGWRVCMPSTRNQPLSRMDCMRKGGIKT